MIELRNVFKKFAGQDEFLFQGANLNVEQGELAIVLGAKAAGKSTLLRMIAARENPDKGSVFVFSKDCSQIPSNEMPYFRRQIGESSCGIGLIESATVIDNLMLPAVIKNTNHKIFQENALSLLQHLGLSLKVQLTCKELSRTEKHLLQVARAIVSQPRLILCDDPFEGCDEELSRAIVEVLWSARSNGSTLVVATNQPNYFTKKPRRQYVIADRRLLENHITQFPSLN